VSKPLSLPAFAPVPEACRILGISRTRLYDLARRDPAIIVQVGGRSVIDIPRAVALIDAMPRGPRKPNGHNRLAPRGGPR
jgi:hypothetical protein